jgi:hypothetical protein
VKVELNRDWTEFLSALIARRVRFVLVGGHAVAGHAEPRFTEDLDVFVEPTLTNAKRLRAALVDFGFGPVVPSATVLAAPDKVFMLGRKPSRIDVLTGIDGVSFEQAWEGRVEADFVAPPLYVIGRAELIANKRASGRPKDLIDLAALKAHAPKPARRKAEKRAPTSRTPSGSRKPR